MTTHDLATRTVDVGSFNRLELQAINVETDLTIEQGDREALTLEAPAHVLTRIETNVHDGKLIIGLGGGWTDRIKDAVQTSLTRPHVRCDVMARKLNGLEIKSLAHVAVAHLDTDRLAVRGRGIADIHIDHLHANRLQVDLSSPGPCHLEVKGEVGEQEVTLGGMSDYSAADLASKRAVVTLKGPGGHATVRAESELDVSISGPGAVAYYGNPKVQQHVGPMGSLTHL